jgi:hypothetical protein
MVIFVFFCVFILKAILVESNVHHHPHAKLPVCIGVIAFRGTHTLNYTLPSYRNSRLLDMVEESVILFQQVDSPGRQRWFEYYNTSFGDMFTHPPIISRTNLKFYAFVELTLACKSPYVLILEEDFAVNVNKSQVAEQLFLSYSLLKENRAQAVRLRNIDMMGEPNHVGIYFQQFNTIQDVHFLDMIVFNRNSHIDFPDRISLCNQKPMTWCASSKYAHYSNNPAMYKKDMIEDFYLSNSRSSFDTVSVEVDLNEKWINRNFTVAWSSGLFTHDRIDGNVDMDQFGQETVSNQQIENSTSSVRFSGIGIALISLFTILLLSCF